MYPGAYAAAHPDQPAFIMATSGLVVTYADYERRCNRLAKLFRSAGLGSGDRVAFFMENHPRLLEAEGAAERAGLYYSCVNSYLSGDEVAYIVNDSGARLVVTSAARYEVARSLPGLCPGVERWLIVDSDAAEPPFEPYEDAVAGCAADPIADERLGVPLLYSSGTTGRPKGIIRPLRDAHPSDAPGILKAARKLMGMREGMVYLSPAPLYHAAPQASVAAAIRFGATSVIMERFDPAQFLELVARHRVTHTQVVPTMFSRLLKLPEEVRAAADLSSLESVVHAAAPCPVPVKERMIEWWGPIISEYYAATEGIGTTFCTAAEWLAHKGTVGRPVLGELLILDDDGHSCPPGTPGTVWFRGGTEFEYHNDPEQTARSRHASGSARTVWDVGYVDDDGYLYLTDRKTNMIISGGVNIYPQETENLLVVHPKVMDAAVIGVPNEDLGEEIKAIVQPTADATPGPDLERELIEFCRAHLAHFKCPRSVDFEAELPRLPTGKLYKRLLRDRYWADRRSLIV